MNTRFFGALALTIAISLPVAGCTSGVASTADVEQPAALPVAVALPRVTDIRAVYEVTGTITAESEAPIRARDSGIVVDILVEEGTAVGKGQVLARLDGERARLEMLRAEAELERLERELLRLTNLHERGLISTAAFETAGHEVDAGKAAFSRAALDYEYTAIRSTIDGVVSDRSIKAGQTLAEGETAFVVTDTAKLVAYLDIPQTELAKFHAGHVAGLTVDANPAASYSATVARISPTIDSAKGTFRATLAIDNSGGSLAPGMFGRFRITWDTHENAIVIPLSALIREDSETSVYVVESGEAVRRSVTTGIQANGEIEIVSGVSAGDSIVLRGQSRLRDGSRVLARSDDEEARRTG